MRALAALVATLVVCGCGETIPRSEVIVFVDADRAVRDRAVRMVVEVEGGTGYADVRRVLLEPTGTRADPVQFPQRVALTPLDDDETRVYTLTATTFDADDAIVAVGRVRSGYVPRNRRYVHLVLEAACGDTCDEDETCKRGTCVTAFIPPDDLDTAPPMIADASVIDGAIDGDAALPDGDAALADGDAALADGDAALADGDAAADADVPDATDPDVPDADASSPDACVPYTCSTFAYNCGNPDDGCGMALSCGSCEGSCATYRCMCLGSDPGLDEIDPPSHATYSSFTLAAGGTHSIAETIKTSSDADWYAFTVSGASQLTVRLTSPGAARYRVRVAHPASCPFPTCHKLDGSVLGGTNYNVAGTSYACETTEGGFTMDLAAGCTGYWVSVDARENGTSPPPVWGGECNTYTVELAAS